jgi:hypothetical protein
VHNRGTTGGSVFYAVCAKLHEEDEWVLRRPTPPLVEEKTAFSNI